jgi:cytochrome P450
MSEMAVVIHKHLDRLPAQGQMNLFETIYDMVLDLIIQVVLGPVDDAEVAVLRVAMKETDIETLAANPLNLLFPSLTRSRRNAAYKRFEGVLQRVWADRKAKNITRGDLLTTAFERFGENNIDGVFALTWSTILAATINQFAATAWMLYFTTAYPAVKAKVAHEIESLGGDYTRYLEDAPYLDATVREVLRLKAMGFVARKSTTPLSLGKYTIPTGSMVMLFHSTINMNPTLFPDPQTFNPERHFENGESKIDDLKRQCKVLGFGAGRHACPGEKLAGAIIKVVFSIFLSSLDMSFVEPPEPPKTFQPLGVMRPSKPCMMAYHKKTPHH